MRLDRFLAIALLWSSGTGLACTEPASPGSALPAVSDISTRSAKEPPDPELVHAAEEVLELARARTAVVRAAPQDGFAWLRLGMAYDAHQLFQQADDCYAVAVQLVPGNTKAWYHYARTRAELSSTAEAVTAMERSIDLRPDFAPSHWHTGIWLLDLGRPEDAEKFFRRSLEIDPDDDAGSIGLARVALERGDAPRASAILESLLSVRPANGYARQLLGTAYREQGRLEQAQLELARSQYSRPVWNDPWKAEVDALGVSFLDRLERLRDLVRSGRGEQALPDLEAMLLENPAHIALLSTLTPALVQNGKFERAIDINRAALREKPDHFRIHMNLSLLSVQAGDPAGALYHADRTVELDPVFAAGHLQRARLLIDADRLEEAVSAFRRAREVGDPSLSVCLALAQTLVNLVRPGEAAAVLETTCNQFPTASEPRAMLADTLADLNRLQDAWQSWRTARDLGHDPVTLAKIEAKLRRVEPSGQ